MESTTQRIIEFLKSIGIPVEYADISAEDQFLPGMCIRNSGLVIDINSLKHPGDLLHEAGHLAVTAPAKRATMNGKVANNSDEDIGEEIMAIAWSYAAAIRLQLDPKIVFHDDGYKGDSDHILRNFSQGYYIGVPMLQWIGLAYDFKNAKENNVDPYPHMIKWVRE